MKTFKKIFASVALFCFMTGMVQANATISNSEMEPATRTEISKDDLPEAVVNSFEKSNYAEMGMSKIFKLEDESINSETGKSVVYEIVVSHDGKKAALFYSEGGDLLKTGEKSSS